MEGVVGGLSALPPELRLTSSSPTWLPLLWLKLLNELLCSFVTVRPVAVGLPASYLAIHRNHRN